ncbi:MAG: hypothetical protein JNL90_05550 [Planctomycetes bacterium]|nr:hypothetical protein [Planctomycetota bacterium]
MWIVRLGIVLLFPAALLALLVRRPRQAAAVARANGAELEGGFFVRPPRAPRLVVWIAAALIVSFLGKSGLAIAFVMALLTAPLAAAGTLRLLATCRAGLIVDDRLHAWDEFSAFTTRDAARELLFLWRDGRAPLRLAVRGVAFHAAVKSIGRHLAQVAAEPEGRAAAR